MDKQQSWSEKRGSSQRGERRGEVWRGRVWVRKTMVHSEAPVMAHSPSLHPAVGSNTGRTAGREVLRAADATLQTWQHRALN